MDQSTSLSAIWMWTSWSQLLKTRTKLSQLFESLVEILWICWASQWRRKWRRVGSRRWGWVNTSRRSSWMLSTWFLLDLQFVGKGCLPLLNQCWFVPSCLILQVCFLHPQSEPTPTCFFVKFGWRFHSTLLRRIQRWGQLFPMLGFWHSLILYRCQTSTRIEQLH